MTTYKNRLPQSALMGYISPAPHKTGAGISTLLTTQAHNRASGFFTCKASSRRFIRIMVGRMGPLSGGPGSCVAGCGNPVRLTTPSFPPLGGELSQLTTQGYPLWQTVNNAAPTRTASTRKPKLIVVCSAQNDWRIACISSLSATTVSCYNCVYRQCSVIWQTTCRNFKNWRERRENNPPENLTQKQHSACWWGVCLHDMQEALSP
ncbi:ash family protein [Salmonella enterica subsp. enterica]|nr:ash family protein [Salmonella enterica subsp. enterica serovar Oranienburg]EEP8810219.1 ash family protein [Salmonella enterica subsp. enterica serovar Oranienburg]